MLKKMFEIVMTDINYWYYKDKFESEIMTIADLQINVEGKRDSCLDYLCERKVVLRDKHGEKIIAKFEILDGFDAIDNYYAIPDTKIKVNEVILERSK